MNHKIKRFFAIAIVILFNACSSAVNPNDDQNLKDFLEGNTFQYFKYSENTTIFLQFFQEQVEINVYQSSNLIGHNSFSYTLGEMERGKRQILIPGSNTEWHLSSNGFINSVHGSEIYSFSPIDKMRKTPEELNKIRSEYQTAKNKTEKEQKQNDSIAQASSEQMRSQSDIPKSEISPPDYQEKGNFQTVKMGGQFWMSENLNVEHYANGDVIPQVQDAGQWSKLTFGAWCYYDNESTNGISLGKLYNWYAVKDPRGLAPKGWKIPNNDEWHRIIGDKNNEIIGIRLKSKVGWDSFIGNNEFGFNALPGGMRDYDGSFKSLHKFVSYWSTEEGDKYHQDEAFNWYLSDEDDGFGVTFGTKKVRGYYVRCINIHN